MGRRVNTTKIRKEGKRFTILHANYSSSFLDGNSIFLKSNNNKLCEISAINKTRGKTVKIMDNPPYDLIRTDNPDNFNTSKSSMQN